MFFFSIFLLLFIISSFLCIIYHFIFPFFCINHFVFKCLIFYFVFTKSYLSVCPSYVLLIISSFLFLFNILYFHSMSYLSNLCHFFHFKRLLWKNKIVFIFWNISQINLSFCLCKNIIKLYYYLSCCLYKNIIKLYYYLSFCLCKNIIKLYYLSCCLYKNIIKLYYYLSCCLYKNIIKL